MTDESPGAQLILELLLMLEDIQGEVVIELEREVKDSHDFSSADYSAYDDGHNEGVTVGIELFRARSEDALNRLLGAIRAGGKASDAAHP